MDKYWWNPYSTSGVDLVEGGIYYIEAKMAYIVVLKNKPRAIRTTHRQNSGRSCYYNTAVPPAQYGPRSASLMTLPGGFLTKTLKSPVVLLQIATHTIQTIHVSWILLITV